ISDELRALQASASQLAAQAGNGGPAASAEPAAARERHRSAPGHDGRNRTAARSGKQQDG
ncbi:MAG TPA: hypothetical protein VE258_12325, partial [Ktedonobacterales bacterium]|nr:hypothetical protein [Ktedonobacterales bacterium]